MTKNLNKSCIYIYSIAFCNYDSTLRLYETNDCLNGVLRACICLIVPSLWKHRGHKRCRGTTSGCHTGNNNEAYVKHEARNGYVLFINVPLCFHSFCNFAPSTTMIMTGQRKLILPSNAILQGRPQNWRYRQISNISHTLVGNKFVDHSYVAGAAPAPTSSSFST